MFPDSHNHAKLSQPTPASALFRKTRRALCSRTASPAVRIPYVFSNSGLFRTPLKRVFVRIPYCATRTATANPSGISTDSRAAAGKTQPHARASLFGENRLVSLPHHLAPGLPRQLTAQVIAAAIAAHALVSRICHRAVSAIGGPTQIMWMAMPISVIFQENAPPWYAESGRTTSCMNQ